MASVNSRTRDGRKVWLAQVSIKGFKRQSKQFADRRAALAWAEAEEAALRKLKQAPDVSPDAASITIKDLIERFLRDPRVRQVRYHGDLQMLLAVWVERYGDRKVRAFGVVQIVDLRDVLLQQGLSGSRANRYLSAMRRAWNWGREVGLIERSAVWPLGVMLSEPRGRSRHLDDDELKAVLTAAREHSPVMYAAIVTSLAAGIRQGELLRLEWKDVDFARSRLTVLESKNNEARSVYLASNAAELLRRLKKAGVVGKQVFLTADGSPADKDWLSYHWKEVRSKAGLVNFRWHDLRHSCASFLASSGASLLEIGSVLGHKSPSVTLRYSHLVQGKPVTGHDALDKKLSK